jgi:hypothetical protein
MCMNSFCANIPEKSGIKWGYWPMVRHASFGSGLPAMGSTPIISNLGPPRRKNSIQI